MSEESIFGMKENSVKRIDAILKIYATLNDVLRFAKPVLICSVCVRMLELTLKTGLSSVSTFAFASYGEILASAGNISEGCHIGMIIVSSFSHDHTI